MQFPTGTLVLLTSTLLTALVSGTIHSGPAIQSVPKPALTTRSTGPHGLRSIATFYDSHHLQRRQSDSVDEVFGKYDEKCTEKNKCDSLSDDHYHSCDSETQDMNAFGKCLCESEAVSKVVRICSACYENPKPILELWRDQCKAVGVNFNMNSSNKLNGNMAGGMWCAAAAVAAVAAAAL